MKRKMAGFAVSVNVEQNSVVLYPIEQLHESQIWQSLNEESDSRGQLRDTPNFVVAQTGDGEEGWRGGVGVGFCNGSSHLGSHCEQGLPFWWRLTRYLLQDHGNSLICSPRVFPLQQWNHCVRTVGQLSAVKPTPTPTQGIRQKRPRLWNTVIGRFWWHYTEWCCPNKTMVMKSRSRDDAEFDCWQWWVWWSTARKSLLYAKICLFFFPIVQQLRSGWQMNVDTGQ